MKYLMGVWVILLSLGLLSNTWAGSFQAPSLGARATGMAGSFVAVADDPSTVYWNPAGLSFLSGGGIMVGNTFIDATGYYETPAGEKEKNIAPVQLVPNMFFSLNLDKSWGLGAGFYTPFGLKQVWRDDSALNFNSTYSEIQLSQLTLAGAWRLSDVFSIGGGMGKGYGILKAKAFYWAPIFPDGYVKLKGEDDTTVFSLGFLWEINPQVKVGGVWRSRATLNFKGNMDIRYPSSFSPFGLTKEEIDYNFKFTLPEVYSLGISYSPNKRWLFTSQIDYVKWSCIKDLTLKLKDTIKFDPGDPTTWKDELEFPRDWEDTCSYRIGVEYKLNDNLSLRGGYMWDPSPVPEETLDPMMFDLSLHRYTVGLGYNWGDWEVNVGYMYSVGKKVEVEESDNTPPTNADYWGSSQVWEVSLTYKF